MDTSEPISLLSPIGYHTGSCGYCKGYSSSGSYYVKAKSISAADYQSLLHRGWRRSGNLLYVPDARHSCCPHHTLRLPVKKYKASRDHRQTLNRWNRFILGEEYEKEAARLQPKSKHSRDKSKQHQGFDLVYTIHATEYASLPETPEPSHRFEVTLESNTFTEVKYLLYEQYQRHVHQEEPSEISRDGFIRFLCTSPLKAPSTSHPASHSGDQHSLASKPAQRLGSYHACYWVDGRLIALGVLDFLPQGISSVYFLYHPDFSKWSLGKVGALREIAMTLEEGLEYYYMGYIIWSCDKMRYKADYKPQEVMMWRTGGWREMADAQGIKDAETQQAKIGNVEGKKGFDSPILACEALEEGPLSLFEMDFPGMMTADEVQEKVDMGKIHVRLPYQNQRLVVDAEDLATWESSDMLDRSSIKGIIGEMAALVGPEVAKNMVVDFTAG
ncbi:arginine-tRNA-protein transferas-like protein 1 [Eremomyces bilateralis CBS 781.70]|uniref:Arginyl-tRNA--protein transferase 1 n=1 Tax=Eremomyces bilateralis CBS 781.70 TaxID=1392243 RepID=A0A6G1FZH7_9PEZI|nr:arginine-tRNA-protein transferas-like protein 1 [Eremomyces bilateralis CBS 781.70]KAF1811203.1 arginine-tRNA-protein transferas-like protein 1 [Eremomyces bilateralis CBS 781.70]